MWTDSEGGSAGKVCVSKMLTMPDVVLVATIAGFWGISRILDGKSDERALVHITIMIDALFDF